MKKIYTLLLISITIATKAQTPITLLSNLQYPTAMWIQGDNVYFTETRGRNTIFGGNITLNRYRISNGQVTLMVNQPENSDAVVVASDGMIYLTSYQGTIPGEFGKVSFVDTTTFLETHLMDIAIASRDMFIDDNDNILIIGSSDLPNANSLYFLPAGNYTNPNVLQTGLSRAYSIAMRNDTVYFANILNINQNTFYFGSNGIIDTFMHKRMLSITFSPNYLFYTDYFGGTIGKVNMQTMQDDTILTGLNDPINVRYVASSNDLYFLEGGTVAAQYTDGTLNVLHNADNFITTINSVETENNQIQIYPNPFHDKAILKMHHLGLGNFQLLLYDMVGKEAAKYEINPLADGQNTEINRGNLSSGIYFYKLQSGNEIIGAGKLIVQ